MGLIHYVSENLILNQGCSQEYHKNEKNTCRQSYFGVAVFIYEI